MATVCSPLDRSTGPRNSPPSRAVATLSVNFHSAIQAGQKNHVAQPPHAPRPRRHAPLALQNHPPRPPVSGAVPHTVDAHLRTERIGAESRSGRARTLRRGVGPVRKGRGAALHRRVFRGRRQPHDRRANPRAPRAFRHVQRPGRAPPTAAGHHAQCGVRRASRYLLPHRKPAARRKAGVLRARIREPRTLPPRL